MIFLELHGRRPYDDKRKHCKRHVMLFLECFAHTIGTVILLKRSRPADRLSCPIQSDCSVGYSVQFLKQVLVMSLCHAIFYVVSLTLPINMAGVCADGAPLLVQAYTKTHRVDGAWGFHECGNDTNGMRHPSRNSSTMQFGNEACLPPAHCFPGA